MVRVRGAILGQPFRLHAVIAINNIAVKHHGSCVVNGGSVRTGSIGFENPRILFCLFCFNGRLPEGRKWVSHLEILPHVREQSKRS